MAVFAIIAQQNSTALQLAVNEKFTVNYFLGGAQWLVSAEPTLTPQDVATKLGAEKGALGKVLVVTVSNYWGYHEANLWPWLKANMS